MRFGILKKFLVAFLALAVLPLVVISFYAKETLFDAGQSVLESSRQALIKNASELLTARARAIAHRVEGMLESSVDNMRAIAAIQPHPAIYYQFLLQHQREIWIRQGTPDYPGERRVRIPLYKEITYLDPNGALRILVDAEGISYDDKDLSKPFRTAYGEENYFQLAKDLPEGEIYVSQVLGRHVRKEEQLQGADHVEHAIGGTNFNGILRFAAPVYSSRQFIGVVSMALDHQHLMEMTQHVLPIGSREVVFPSYRSGNYAFLFDDEGWIITHPKFWDIRGYDQDTGKLLDPTIHDYNEANLKAGRIPFNLMYVPFIHVNYRHIAMETLAGRSGITQTHSVGGVPRVLAFAPIVFEYGEFKRSGYFGGVTLGAKTSFFHQAVEETSQDIQATFDRTVRNFILIILMVGAGVVLTAVILARGFTLPILHLTQKVKDISRGNFDVQVTIRTDDELAVLGTSIQDMGQRLKENQESLVHSLKQLEASKTEVELSNQRLEAQVNMLKIIHRVGHLLSVNFNQDQVLDLIARTCVEGIGFHRAAVFLIQPDQQTVERVHVQSRSPIKEEDHPPLPLTCPMDPDAIDPTVTAFADPNLEHPINGAGSAKGQHRQAFVPLRMAERIIGVLGADHPADHAPIAAGELESLKIIGNEAAMALERVRLMKEALGEKEFIQRIFANMMSAVLVIGPGGLISAANPRAAALLNCEPDTMIGQPAAKVLSTYPSLYDHLIQAAREQRAGSTDLEIGKMGDATLFAEVAVSTFQDEPDSPDPSILAIFRDITRRKQLERVITRSDRLVSVGTLAAGIAHEIRNPLTGISLMLDDLHDRMSNRTDERLMMQQALEEIEKLERIVTDLLEFAAKPTSHLAVQDLNSIVNQTRVFVQKQCDQQKVTLSMACADALPPLLLDAEKIRQAVLNIIINALRAMPVGGTIHISTKQHRRLDLFDGQAGVELSVEDTGSGIDPEDMNYIFDPFFTRHSDGYGLGLSITHTIIEEHGAKITVDSEPGKGTVFRIFFPEQMPEKE